MIYGGPHTDPSGLSSDVVTDPNLIKKGQCCIYFYPFKIRSSFIDMSLLIFALEFFRSKVNISSSSPVLSLYKLLTVQETEFQMVVIHYRTRTTCQRGRNN